MINLKMRQVRDSIKYSRSPKIVCRPKGRELLGIPKSEVHDIIEGYNCTNCDCDVQLSPEKVAIMTDDTILLCYDCFNTLLSDKEYVKQQQFIDLYDQEENKIGKALKKLITGSEE